MGPACSWRPGRGLCFSGPHFSPPKNDSLRLSQQLSGVDSESLGGQWGCWPEPGFPGPPDPGAPGVSPDPFPSLGLRAQPLARGLGPPGLLLPRSAHSPLHWGGGRGAALPEPPRRPRCPGAAPGTTPSCSGTRGRPGPSPHPPCACSALWGQHTSVPVSPRFAFLSLALISRSWSSDVPPQRPPSSEKCPQ